MVKRETKMRTNKTRKMMLRMTPEQHEAMKRAATAAGLDLSAWLRMVGWQAATKP
jgi:predicted HicB family RNase H-like nuclease